MLYDIIATPTDNERESRTIPKSVLKSFHLCDLQVRLRKLVHFLRQDSDLYTCSDTVHLPILHSFICINFRSVCCVLEKKATNSICYLCQEKKANLRKIYYLFSICYLNNIVLCILFTCCAVFTLLVENIQFIVQFCLVYEVLAPKLT